VPTTSGLRFDYTLPARGRARLAVYDLQGRHVTEIANENGGPGKYAATWNGRNAAGEDVPSGVYFLRLELGSEVTAQKVVMRR
jgi:hypothetical protein